MYFLQKKSNVMYVQNIERKEFMLYQGKCPQTLITMRYIRSFPAIFGEWRELAGLMPRKHIPRCFCPPISLGYILPACRMVCSSSSSCIDRVLRILPRQQLTGDQVLYTGGLLTNNHGRGDIIDYFVFCLGWRNKMNVLYFVASGFSF